MMFLLAASTFDPNNPGTWVAPGGAAGAVALIVFLFVKGWIVPGYLYRELSDANREKNARLDKVVELWQEKVIPALTESTEAHKKVSELVTTLLIEINTAQRVPRPSPGTRKS